MKPAGEDMEERHARRRGREKAAPALAHARPRRDWGESIEECETADAAALEVCGGGPPLGPNHVLERFFFFSLFSILSIARRFLQF